MKIINHSKLSSTVLIAVGSIALLVSSQAKAQILQYNFDAGTGTTAASTGSQTTSVTLENVSGTPTNLYSASGAGVSGQAGDFAFNNTASTGMGNTGAGGVAATSAIASLASLTSFTVVGWFKTDGSEEIGNNAQILNLGGSGGFLVNAPAPGNLALQVAGVGASSASSAVYTGTSSWEFFALTYDGTSTSNNVNFFVGTTASSVVSAGTATLNQGTTPNGSQVLTIGNNGSTSGNSRPFDGLLDDFAIYGATAGNSGVLSQSALESIRLLDVSPVPEPSTYALMVAGLVMLIGFRRRATRA